MNITQCDYADARGRCTKLARFAVNFARVDAAEVLFHSRFPAFPAVACRTHTLHALQHAPLLSIVNIPPHLALAGI